MKFDRNTVLGFVILAALFFGYFFYTNKEQAVYKKQKAEKEARELAVQDSIAKLNKPLQDSLNKIRDSVTQKNMLGIFQDTAKGEEQLVTLQNELIKITFTRQQPPETGRY